MKKLAFLFWAMLFAGIGLNCSRHREKAGEEGPVPNDYLWAQRAFPYQTVPSETYYQAVEWAVSQASVRGGVSLNWTPAGPNNVGGRITDLGMHPSDLLTIYAATASGGVWKSTDAGLNWAPVSDHLPSLSIGDIAIDPSDKNTLYCGTGETNGGGGSVTYDGRGVYKSTDAGENWLPLGLEATGSIGRIEVDPKNPNRVFVAAMGHLFGNNPERGVYRSTDGGLHWDKKLFVNDSVGVIDLAIHPENPDTLFAVSWERIRRPNKLVYGGPGSAIWRSVDGGDNWTRLSGGLPQGANTGRIGIAIAASEPNVLYATVANKSGFFSGVYKSTDHGDTWLLQGQGNSDPGYFSYGWWFGQIRVDPGDANHLYNLGVNWVESFDGGDTWFDGGMQLHADHHAIFMHPADPNLLLEGNDGGIYISQDAGATWQHRPLPITQFYTSEINFQHPDQFSGGAQDNGTWKGAAGQPDQWEHIFGGDGFVTLINPLNENIWYAESQYGGMAGSNGVTAPVSGRYNWNTPYIFDPHNPDILYFGAERLFKSINGGLNWTAISPDLSSGNTGSGGIVYGTITSIAASAIDGQVLFAGTDEGQVWTSSTGGGNWTKVSDDLPKRWVTRVITDLWDSQTAYVCLSGYRHGEAIAHLYKTTDLGQTWTNVAGDLPDVPINDLILDPLDPALWYIATDAGVFSTADGGAHWTPANLGLPSVPVLDLTFHAPTRTLVAATYGRSMYQAKVPVPSGATEPGFFENVWVSPNPFEELCQLHFSTVENHNLRLELYDLTGKRVKTCFEGNLPAGNQNLTVDGRDLSPGVYLLSCRVSGEKGICKKVLKI